MNVHHAINYVEFATCDLAASIRFLETVFGWRFTDYGPDYSAFTGSGIDGGLYRAAPAGGGVPGVPLVVVYSEDLGRSLATIEQAGGMVTRPIFSFPGGRRFHFTEPGGNELAVWSDRQ